jgi:hypothetical protein
MWPNYREGGLQSIRAQFKSSGSRQRRRRPGGRASARHPPKLLDGAVEDSLPQLLLHLVLLQIENRWASRLAEL